MSRGSGRRSFSLGRVRKAAEYARDGVEKATAQAKDGLEEFLGYHAASRHEANNGSRLLFPGGCDRPPASAVYKQPTASFGRVTKAGLAAAGLRHFSLGATGRTTARDSFEEFYGYEGRPEPRKELDLEQATTPGAGVLRLLKQPVAGEKSSASRRSSGGRGRSPAAFLRGLSAASNTKTRDGFEEFFGYEGTKTLKAECSSDGGIRQNTCKRLSVLDPPPLLRDGRSCGNAKRSAADRCTPGKLAQSIDQQVSCPQVMDATEASLSMIRTAIEERKELLKAQTTSEEFERLCEEIASLKSQQARLAGALWESQLQSDSDDVGTEMQLKAWLGKV